MCDERCQCADEYMGVDAPYITTEKTNTVYDDNDFPN